MKLARVVVVVAVGFALGAGAFGITQSSAQQAAWSWPEKSKNLKVLPENTDAQKLRAVMTGFTRALGVRCNYCHVGKDGEPLSTFDFASDEKDHKDIARGMMRMTDSINVDIGRIVTASARGGPSGHADRLTVGCFTCHHGVARPRTLADDLSATYEKAGADSALARFRALRGRYYGSAAFDFTEGALAELGRRAIAKKDFAGAVAAMRLNAEQFPESGQAQSALAEAHLAAGDTANAIVGLEKAVKLDPSNERAARMLEQLKKR